MSNIADQGSAECRPESLELTRIRKELQYAAVLGCLSPDDVELYLNEPRGPDQLKPSIAETLNGAHWLRAEKEDARAEVGFYLVSILYSRDGRPGQLH